MNEFSKGFVAVFDRTLTADDIRSFVNHWLENFECVEQVLPGQIATTRIRSQDEIMVRSHMQFRILNGDQFAWAYASLSRRSIETTGLVTHQGDQLSLCLEVLTGLSGVTQIIPDHDDDRLDALESEGLL